jgi:hypothetical protein
VKRKVAIPRSLVDVNHGESFVLPRLPRFGPMFAQQVIRQGFNRAKQLLSEAQLDHQYDDLIRAEFERLRKGVSLDRFLADPILSLKLSRACAARGLKAPEYAINLRLFALRKIKKSAFKTTERPTRAHYLIEEYGPAVETAMRLVKFRFGASVDDMIAHPAIGEVFVKVASAINPGGTPTQYRLCALQIRKSRNLTGVYEKIAESLEVEWIESRWLELGTIDQAFLRDVSERGGLIKIYTTTEPLYILRTNVLNDSLHQTLRPQHIKKLLDIDTFLNVEYADLRVQAVKNADLPGGTPKAWELKLIDAYNPLLNWPVNDREAA